MPRVSSTPTIKPPTELNSEPCYGPWIGPGGSPASIAITSGWSTPALSLTPTPALIALPIWTYGRESGTSTVTTPFDICTVKGHATEADVAAGTITLAHRLGNHGADALATARRDAKQLPLNVQHERRNMRLATMLTQHMMLQICKARNQRILEDDLLQPYLGAWIVLNSYLY